MPSGALRHGGQPGGPADIDTVNAHRQRVRLGILAIEDRIEKSVAEHARIAEAVVAGDGSRAESVMADRLSNLRTMLVGLMKAFHYPG